MNGIKGIQKRKYKIKNTPPPPIFLNRLLQAPISGEEFLKVSVFEYVVRVTSQNITTQSVICQHLFYSIHSLKRKVAEQKEIPER